MAEKPTNVIRITALHLPGGDIATYSARTEGTAQALFYCLNVSMVDNYNPSWSSEAAYGKMDAMPFYSSTTRKFNVEFLTVGIYNDYSPTNLQKTMDKLISFQYPRYSEARDGTRAIAAPPLFQYEFYKENRANTTVNYSLFKAFTGYIEQLQITPGTAGGITVGGKPLTPVVEGDNMFERGYKVSFDFTVLHESTQGWERNRFLGDQIFSGTPRAGGQIGGDDSDVSLKPAEGFDQRDLNDDVKAIV
tara:strand:- start:4685 stop:5428 length:744 start_codon:yes stop_codon:yes gene_type:complete